MFGTRLYTIWASMKARVKNKNDKDFPRYGALGIALCSEWELFENFYEWAMNNGYEDTLSIDRIDGTKGYEPSNCRWATAKQQQNNVKTNVVVELNGEKKTLKEWCEFYDLNYHTVWKRFRKYGWSIERSLEIKL